jgi:hypothetical protein
MTQAFYLNPDSARQQLLTKSIRQLRVGAQGEVSIDSVVVFDVVGMTKV